MSHIIGISGSVIFSAEQKFDYLFARETISHIEIGEFANEAAVRHFLALRQASEKSFALHVPLIRNRSKNDILEKVDFEPVEAWRQLEDSVRIMSDEGAEYILLHFPYLTGEKRFDTQELIEAGLQGLSRLQNKYDISIVCEPKLGFNRSPMALQALDEFPVETWAGYGIGLCIDLGDYLIAFGDKALVYIEKWADQVKVVHLHNVRFEDDKYIWIPVHATEEAAFTRAQVQALIECLTRHNDVYFVFEHTAETPVSDPFFEEGISWLKQLITKT